MTLNDLKNFACFAVTFPMSLTWHYSSSCASCSQGTHDQHRLCAGNTQCPVLGSEALFPQQTLQSELVGMENKPLALTGHTSTDTQAHAFTFCLSALETHRIPLLGWVFLEKHKHIDWNPLSGSQPGSTRAQMHCGEFLAMTVPEAQWRQESKTQKICDQTCCSKAVTLS